LVRIGTVVDGGKVSVFNDSEMRIVLPDRTVVLQLAAGAGETSSNASNRRSGRQHRRWPHHGAAGRPGSHDSCDRQVSADHWDDDREAERPDAASDLGRRVAAIAHLPVNARVIAINDQPVVSTDRAIAEIDRALSMGQGMTLNLESLSGEPPGRVYLIPQRD